MSMYQRQVRHQPHTHRKGSSHTVEPHQLGDEVPLKCELSLAEAAVLCDPSGVCVLQ